MTVSTPIDSEITVAGVRTFIRTAGVGDPVIFVHGNPDTADEWAPFLAQSGRLGRVITPDLPGFGRSARPDQVTLLSLRDWFVTLVDELEIERYRLVVHDWGVVGLAGALMRPEQLERLVIIDAVPLLDSYRWHWLARAWRTRLLGELSMVGFRRPVLRQITRLSSPRPGPMSDAFLDDAMAYFDNGTRRAVLSLYRSADPDVLGAAGATLGQLRCPTLVVWGEGDPYIGPQDGQRMADAIPGAQITIKPGVGHWCWREDPQIVEDVISFLQPTEGDACTTT